MILGLSLPRPQKSGRCLTQGKLITIVAILVLGRKLAA